jgi:hypothetical protein
MDCGTPIAACMGFCIAEDIVACFEGRQTTVRELCGKCVLLRDIAAGHCDAFITPLPQDRTNPDEN